jgi:hypothetical protein
VGGLAHHGKDVVYGTAINEAYRLDSQCAEHPLTLLPPTVPEDAKRHGRQFQDCLVEDGSAKRHISKSLEMFALTSGSVSWILFRDRQSASSSVRPMARANLRSREAWSRSSSRSSGGPAIFEYLDTPATGGGF